jgi:hypothetical protein
MPETRTIAIAALAIAIVVGIMLYVHSRPNIAGLPHGVTGV